MTRSGKFWVRLLLPLVLLAFGSVLLPAGGQTGEAEDPLPFFVRAENVDLTCHPARIVGVEGRWTFYLRGKATVGIEAAQLIVGRAKYDATRIEYPTPNSALVDFQYSPLPVGKLADFVLKGVDGEVARFMIDITEPTEVPARFRQSHLVRLQLSPWTLQYPTHGTCTTAGGAQHRLLAELGGDKEFLTILGEMGIEKVRKAIPRYAEEDTAHWVPQLEREEVLPATILRQYIIYLDEARSEDAFKEIFRGLPRVEGAYVNVDRTKTAESSQE